MPIARRGLGAIAGGLFWPCTTRRAAAETFPTRPIRMVVPFTAGGGTDVVGRELAQLLGVELGQVVLIDNRPGGGTVLGSDLVAKTTPDGHTLLLTTSALAINASLVRGLPYDTERDFAPVGLICYGPNVIVTRPDSPLRSVQDIVTAARAAPGASVVHVLALIE